MSRVIKLPRPLRLYIASFAVFLVPIASVCAVFSLPGQPFLLVPAAVFGFASWQSIRQARLSVELQADTLYIRNRFRTLRVARADVAGFESGIWSTPSTFGGILVILRSGARVGLDVAARSTILVRGRTRQDQWLAELEAWRTESQGA